MYFIYKPAYFKNSVMNKTIFLLFLTTFLLSFSLNAQIKDSISVDTMSVNDFKFYNIENYKFPFEKKYSFVDISINSNSVKQPFFQKYNNTSSLNDFYVTNNDGTYTYVKSGQSLENLHRGVKIDSYNPKGMSTNGTSLIFGAFGIVLDKLQN